MNPRAATVLAVLLACPLAARADEPNAAATHGGVILEVGDGAARVEFVHDPRTGTVSVYGLTEPGRTLNFNDAPKLALATSWGPREISLTRIEGQVNAWKATDTTLLKTDSLAGELRLRVDGKRYTAALGPSTPMQPAALERRGGDRGGMVFEIGPGAGRLEFVQDPPSGSVTIYVVPEPGTSPQLTAAPVLVVTTSAGPKSIPFTRVGGEAYVWKATNFEFLKTDQRLEGEVRLTIGGNPYTVSLSAPAPARTTLYERRYGAHGGMLLDVGDGSGRVEVIHDPVLGTVTVYEAGTGVTFDEPPVFLVSSPSGPREVALVRVDGQGNAWRATNADLWKSPNRLDGQIRARVSGRAYTIAVAGDVVVPDRGPHGGPVLVLADGTRIEWLHDATLGTLTFTVIDRPGLAAVAFAEEPSVTLTSDPEPKETRLARVEGTNSWRISAAALKSDAVRGMFRVRIGSQVFEAPFQTSSSADARVDRPLVPETGVPVRAAPEGATSFGIVTAAVPSETRAELRLAPDAGAVVRSVRPGSDAAAIGLQAGDVITDVNGRKATPANVDGLLKVSPGEKLSVEIVRGSKVKILGR